MWGPGKGFTSELNATFVAAVVVLEILFSLFASDTISSISLLAISKRSGVPSTKTFLIRLPATFESSNRYYAYFFFCNLNLCTTLQLQIPNGLSSFPNDKSDAVVRNRHNVSLMLSD